MNAVACLLVVASCGLLVAGSSSLDVGYDGGYEDMLMQGLYKRLAQLDPAYLVDELDEPSRDELRQVRDYEIRPERESAAASIRDSEYIQHSSNAGSQGFIHMTGGSGEGHQHLTPDGSVDNIKPGGSLPVKSDAALPFYCHPANPCPKGYTSEDGCEEDIEDSAEFHKEWISSMQKHGYCSCDPEHMFECPDNKAIEPKMPVSEQSPINDVVNKILADRASATYMSGEKRLTLVAKKSPRYKRSISDEDIEARVMKASDSAKKRSNPYLQGDRLRTVAKKG
jgi:hypothetical protein